MTEEWTLLTLGELTESTRPICYGVLKPGDHIPGGVPLIRIGDMEGDALAETGYHCISQALDEEFRRSRLNGGEVLLSIQGTVGRVAICPLSLVGANISRTVAVIAPDARIEPAFLRLFLQKVALEDGYDDAGSTRASLNISTIRQMQVPVPPLPVQRRIVDLLAHLDNHLANLQTEREALAAARNVALRLSLAGNFLNELGSEWRTSTLGEVAEIRGGGTPSTKEPDFWGGEIVWLTPTEVVKADGQKIGSSERSITQNGLDNSSAKLLPEGSVLLTTRASVGFVAIADKPLATNQGFQSLIPGGDVLSQFLLYWVQGNRNEFSMRASGSTFPEISKKKVASIPITYPSLAVQRRIVSVLSDMDEQVVALTKEFDGLSDLRSSLLSSLLSGAIEVNQNYDSLLPEVA